MAQAVCAARSQTEPRFASKRPLHLHPDPTLYFNRGLAHAKAGSRDKAIADYTEAISRKPDLAIAYYNRGYEHELEGNLDLAVGDYRQALAFLPGLKPAAEAIKRVMSGRL